MKRKLKITGILIILIISAILILSIWHFSFLSSIINLLQTIIFSGYKMGVGINEELLLILPTALPYIITVSIFFAGLFLANRERYVHGFRNADLNFFQQTLDLNNAETPSEIEILVRKGQMWLRVSESFRRNAVYLSFSTAYMILATLFFIISLIVLAFDKKYFIVLTWIGLSFFTLSLLGHLGRYGYGQTRFRSWWHFYKRFSWMVCNEFPPIAPPLIISHLARWKEIGEAIQKDKRFMSYLEKLDEYQDLKEFTEYIEPQKVPFLDLMFKNKKRMSKFSDN